MIPDVAVPRSCCSDGLLPARERPRSSCCNSCCCSRVGPTSMLIVMVIDIGVERSVVCAGRVEPKRSFTSYLKLFEATSKPRTKSSWPLGLGLAPHPFSPASPLIRRSRPLSGLAICRFRFARCGNPILSELKETFRLPCIVQGLVQELRAANWPSCPRRQDTASRVPVASRFWRPALSAGSVTVAGS